MPVDLVAGLATQFLALRTENYPSGRIESEVSCVAGEPRPYRPTTRR
jgi:hypothetical protein